MIYRCEFADVDGVRYLSGYSLVREDGHAESDDEIEGCPGDVRTADGRFRWRLVDNPDCGSDGDYRKHMLEDNPQPAPPVDEVAEAQKTRRAALAAALPDILLAVADGADLAAEVRKVISASEEARRVDGQR